MVVSGATPAAGAVAGRADIVTCQRAIAALARARGVEIGGEARGDDRSPAVIHLVPHTHWDREWYEPFQVFRLRLVDLIDQLLERMAADPRLRFTLDGQTATVDDYLEVRPEAEPLIRQLIAEGRLAIGPWLILLDEFLVSGETIVRNLEMGWQRAEALGGAMRVGYLPDMFGHIAQMPQILRRAGIDRAAVWRGVPASIDRHTSPGAHPTGRPSIPSTCSAAMATAPTCSMCRPPRRQARRVPADQRGHVRRPLAPRDVRDRPRRPLAEARRPRRARQRQRRRRRGPVGDPDGVPRSRPSAASRAGRRCPDLEGRAAVRCASQHADERHLGPGRPQIRRGARRTPAGAVRGAVGSPARDGLAGTPARARLATPGRELRRTIRSVAARTTRWSPR